MIERIVTLIIGLIGGIAVGLQSPLAGDMSSRVGGAASSFIIHVGGAIASGLLLAARSGENISQWRGLPWYMLASGVFGLVLYLTLAHTLPRLGAVASIMLIIGGQLATGVIIDHFGWFGVTVRSIDFTRVLALLLLLAGGYLLVRG